MIHELDLRTAQDISLQLDAHFEEIGLEQTPNNKFNILLLEAKELAEAWDDCNLDNSPEKKEHLKEEFGDLLYCVLSSMKDVGIDANEALNDTFTKIFGRVNREHIANVREDTGLNGVPLYKEAKVIYHSKMAQKSGSYSILI